MKFKIYQSKISLHSIAQINSQLDKLAYSSTKFVFPGEHVLLREKILQILKQSVFLQKVINEESYIVFRLVKPQSTKSSNWYHFDNYINTYVVPIKLPVIRPKGNLLLWQNARRPPLNLLSHLLSKILFQNYISYLFVSRFFLHKFEEVEPREGDILRFDGFTTLHYNQMTSTENRIIVIHNAKPFRNSKIIFFIEWLSRFLAKKIVK